ncbi:MAG: DUF819 family protein [Verrucomicrobia bacterium]|nr:DUF819 family protein [Verrucomicrobiota bacterium]
MAPLIAPDNPWPLWAVMIVGVAVCIYLEQTRPWAAKISGPVLALIGGMLLSNGRIMPIAAPSYDLVDDYLVPVAIPLLLFRANVVKIIRETGSMFLCFHLASLGTVLGAFLAAFIFQGSFPRAAEVTGVMTGSYIGGGVNFVAIKNTYNISPELTNPLLVADNFIMAGMFAVLFVISGSKCFLARFRHPHTHESNSERVQELAARYWQRKEVALLDIAKALAIAFAVTAAAMLLTQGIKSRIESKVVQSIFANPYVLITFFIVGVTTVFHRSMERIHGAEEIGVYLLYVFFFVIGLRADLWQVVLNVPVLFAFCTVMAATNLFVTLLAGKVLRLNLEELLLSVNATLGGAPSAAAMAISKGWSNLVLPGLLAGIWGYVIGTFVGIVVAEMLLKVL